MPNSIRVAVFALLLTGLWTVEAMAWNPQVISGRCRQTGNSCNGTIGNAGQGRGSCCDPAKGASATLTCEKQNTCTGGKPFKWDDTDIPVKWWFNPNGMAGKAGYSRMTEAQIEGLLKQSWDGWTKPVCTSFRHSYRGKNNNLLSIQDRQTTLFLASEAQWAQMGAGPNTLAFTRPVPDRRTGKLQDADIAFNPRPARGVWSVSLMLATAAHEIGHAIGFAHTGDPKALMYFAASGQATTLTKDEVNAVCFTYKKKGPCTKDADCGGCLRCSNGNCVPKNIPNVRNLCKPCTKPADCGGPADICVRLEEGQRCAMACDSQGCCPNGYRCSDIGSGQKMCIPDTGKCPDVRCTSDTQCGPGESCQNSVCRPKPIPTNPKTCKACTSDGDCGSGSRCLSFDGKQRCLMKCVADNFCPTNYKCAQTSAGRLCLPEKTYCPCTGNADCLQGEACRAGVCRPAECKLNCPCSEDGHCSPKHKCYQTQQGGICAQPCGTSAGFGKGVPGSPCDNGRCSNGSRCYQLGQGQSICLKPCRSPNDCGSAGACYQLSGQTLCLCQRDSQCGGGTACNKSVLGQAGAGACAPKSTGAQCDKGYKCSDASGGKGGLFICQPDGSSSNGTKKVGESCLNPTECKKGLQCLRLQQGSTTGYCFEECGTTNTCKFGGGCVLGSQGSSRRFCGCHPTQAPCQSGQTCKVITQGVGVCQGEPTTNKCGNGACDAGENCSTCAKDCACPTGKKCGTGGTCVDDKPPASCGDGRCAGSETCGNCAKDCGCSTGKKCINNQCQKSPDTSKCGDGVCNGTENCGTCAKDCACSSGKTCQKNVCTATTTTDGGTSTDTDSNTLPCPVEDQSIGADGKPVCPEKTGCGCSVSPSSREPWTPVAFLMFFVCAWAVRRRTRS